LAPQDKRKKWKSTLGGGQSSKERFLAHVTQMHQRKGGGHKVPGHQKFGKKRHRKKVTKDPEEGGRKATMRKKALKKMLGSGSRTQAYKRTVREDNLLIKEKALRKPNCVAKGATEKGEKARPEKNKAKPSGAKKKEEIQSRLQAENAAGKRGKRTEGGSKV